MKKQLFLASALALVTLASCGGNKTNNWYTPGTKLKIGLICLHDNASTYDKNFIDAFNTAADAAKAAGKVSEAIVKTNVGEDQSCADAAKQLVNQGCNIIFSDSFGHDEFMYATAKDYPQVIFSSATGILARNGVLNNYHNAFASIYEGRYLAGFAAGKYLEKLHESDSVLDSNFNVGYVGAWDYAEVISGYTSWFLGLKQGLKVEHRDNAHMKVKYTYSWYDENLEKNTALALIDQQNCILISQHADSMGAPKACSDKGIPNISYNIETTQYNTYIGYSKINWAPYYTEVINKTFEGRAADETDRNWTGTLDTESVKWDVSSKHFTADEKKVITNEEAELKKGTKHVFDTKNFTVTKSRKENEGKNIKIEGDKDTGKVTSYFADVTGDYAPDTDFQMIDENGFVKESYYRSAPSFDLIIDGIDIIE